MDVRLQRLLRRNFHIALRGESKCGKSWLRQQNIPDAIVVQCRLNKTPKDLYTDILSQLGLNLVVEKSSGKTVKATLEATQELGVKILAKLAFKQTIALEANSTAKSKPVGRDLEDLRFVSDIIKESGRRLVIEDFHYLSPEHRTEFAFDLKALWDYGIYVIVIGIWSENNLLIHLNSDLAGRIEEVPIYWSPDDLKRVLDLGSDALRVTFPNRVSARLIEDSFGTVGILQRLALDFLDEAGIDATLDRRRVVGDENMYEAVAMAYAEQLNALYQTFAQNVANGIRQRANSTGIYAHMLKVVMDATDAQLNDGLPTDNIFKEASQRENRIKRANLGSIMRKINALQVDKGNRGLILSYDETKDEVFVVDKHLFFYRKYATAQWPWERVIQEAEDLGDTYDGQG
ncbi:hypothetical protein [Sphingomonas sp. Leaf257]|uniref:hypothetical protein n=1 Tax=Sphingomonas sp. Leaf257 TaxID=1736309 RepID=UPI00191C5C1A|nr:hypothetical protein [Sphingomonas sp. Leaf257]